MAVLLIYFHMDAILIWYRVQVREGLVRLNIIILDGQKVMYLSDRSYYNFPVKYGGNITMKDPRRKSGPNWWNFSLILTAAFAVLGIGYFLYQKSVGQAVYSTTKSFMKQIADHDNLNVENQMNAKWETLDTVLTRVESSKNNSIEDVIYTLSVEAQVTAFDKLYLITEDERVYSNAYLETALEEMPWEKIFQQSGEHFVARHSEDNREQWGEYLIYGTHLKMPINCAGENISGIIGLVPISEIASQMRLESFDGQGIAAVMEPSGEIITASQYYSTETDQNYFVGLKEADFKRGSSLEACKKALGRGESPFVEYDLNGESFYALFQPMEYKGGDDWYLVVQVSTQVTSEQVRTLVVRSLPFFLLLGIIIILFTYLFYNNVNAVRVAQASEQAKSAFLANMSHEIRTPLNGIVGLQYLMRKNLNDPQKMEVYLRKAEVSAEFLKSVITDVLDMSKIESGQMEIYQKEMDIARIVEEIKTLLEMQAEEKGLCFTVDADEVPCPFVTGDELRVKQVLTNLLGNAFKFTPKGGKVSLTIRQELKAEAALTTFVVADTGSGMSPEFLERIWEPFEQERRIASQNGTGLGTTLSKTLVEKMGGTITVESQLGSGTIFTVSIPFPVALGASGREAGSAAEEDSNIKEEEWNLKGKRILVAEDNEINRMIVVSILKEQGCILTETENGQEAADTFINSGPFYFDLILMDIQMPVMDGYQAAALIRSLNRPDSSRVAIFAMTANAFREDAEKALESGMDDVITKPLDVPLLLNKIRDFRAQEE